MDREKVIKGLKCLITDDVPCNGCSYNGSGYCIKNIASDALDLLKEQEAVKPVLDKQTGRIWLCGKCGSYVGFEDNDPHDPNEFDRFCRDCGTLVLWKGR